MPTLRKIAGKVADPNRARLSPSERKARAATLERHAAELLASRDTGAAVHPPAVVPLLDDLSAFDPGLRW